MDGDSDSDISLLDDHDDNTARTTRPARGKGKQTDVRRKSKGKAKNKDQAYTWEASYTRSWDTVQEDEAGSLQSAVDDWMARGRRRRLLAPTAAIRRTIIRHLILLLDLSTAMNDRDMRPTRFDLALSSARAFVTEWFDQNPLGQIGIVGMRAGIAERIGTMSGNPQDVLNALADRHKLEPTGEPSLQNAIEMARSIMSHLPTHSSREILIIFGSLTTCDPGNIHETLDSCIRNRIRVSVVALAAEMKICRELCERTGGQFAVAMNEGHFKDLLFELVPPPAQRTLPRSVTNASASQGTTTTTTTNPAADLMMMGFPTRLPTFSPPSLCVCHSEMRTEGFLCPRCLSKACDVPTDCSVCGLMVVSAPHLARSYHHLFPVRVYDAVMTMDTVESEVSPPETMCHGCARPFPVVAAATASRDAAGANVLEMSAPTAAVVFDADAASSTITTAVPTPLPVGTATMATATTIALTSEGVSPIGRYRCPECGHHFCADCDVFVHDVVHCCPGCGK